jgi:uncharacterized membrane protein
LRVEVVATIVCMALVTYAVQAGGMWLMGRVTPSPRVDAWLEQIPGAILVSLVVPTALAAGAAGAIALLVTVVTAVRSGNVLFAMIAGVATMWFFRRI